MESEMPHLLASLADGARTKTCFEHSEIAFKNMFIQNLCVVVQYLQE